MLEKLFSFNQELKKVVKIQIKECRKRNSWEHRAMNEGMVTLEELKTYFTGIIILSSCLEKYPEKEAKENTYKVFGFFVGKNYEEAKEMILRTSTKLMNYKEKTKSLSSFVH